MKINDTVLYEPDLHEVVERLVPSAMFHGGLTAKRIEKYRDQAIEIMIEEELLYQIAKKKRIKIKKKKVDEAEEKMIRKYRDMKQYEQALRNAGMTRKGFREKIKKGFLIEKLIEVEIDKKATATEKESKQYYTDNKGNFKMPESRRLREILIKVDPSAPEETWQKKKEYTEGILKRARSGEDFRTLAWNYSTDKYRVKEGDLGVVHEGRLQPELQEIAWKMKAGEISDVIRTIYGFHIIKVEEVIPEEQLEFEAVKGKIREIIIKDKKERLKKELLSSESERAEIEIY